MAADRETRGLGVFQTILSGMMLVALAIVAGGYFYINQAGGLRRLLESELTKMTGSGTAAVGEARVNFAIKSQPISFTARDITIDLGQSRLSLPSAELYFGFFSLLNGQPEAIMLRGLKLDLVRQDSGWSGSSAFLFLAQIANEISSKSGASADNSERVRGIKRVGIEIDSLSLAHSNQIDSRISFSDTFIDLTASKGNKVSGSVRATRLDASGSDEGSFTVSFDGRQADNYVNLDISASNFETQDISSYFDIIPDVFQEPGVLSGHVGLEVKKGRLHRFNADVDLKNGVLIIPEVSDEAKFNSARLVFSYSRKNDSLNVRKAELEMANSRSLSVSGKVNHFHTPSPSVIGSIEASGVTIGTIIENWPDQISSDIKEILTTNLKGGIFKKILSEFQGIYHIDNSELTLSKFDLNSDFSGVRADLKAGQYERMVATVGGTMGIAIGQGGRIDLVDIDLAIEDGSILIPDRGGSVNVQSGNMAVTLQKNVISLENFDLDMGKSGNFKLGGELLISKNWRIDQLELDLSVPDMEVGLFSALWPEWAASKTRDWVNRNIPAGRVNAAKLGIMASFDSNQDNLVVKKVSGDLQLNKSELVWQKDAPRIKNVEAALEWDNDEFNANIKKGHIDDLEIQRGRITILPVLREVSKDAVVSFIAKGSVETLKKIVNHTGFRKFGNIDLANIKSDGDVELSLKARVPIKKTARLADSIQTIDANISNGSFVGLPSNLTVRNAELLINFDRDFSQITGTASISGVVSEFGLQIDNSDSHIELILQAPPSPYLAKLLAQTSGLNISGSLGGKLRYSGDPLMNESTMAIALDLGGSYFSIPEIDWTKLPVEDGWATLTVALRDGKISKLTDLDFFAGSLSARGQVIFGASGQVEAAMFERAAWPGNDLRDLIIEGGRKGSWKIGATARRINLEPLRRNKGVVQGDAIEFDFTGDQIQLDENISMSGQVVGKRDSSGGGAAEFLGKLLVRGKPLINEAKLDVRFGPSGEFATGVGLIGGSEAKFDFEAKQNLASKLTIVSKNGGRVLAGLDVTEAVRGGTMRMVNWFEDRDFRSYDTHIEIANFSVVEAPRALRLFSVLSLAGLYALVEGDGTAFRKGEAVFQTRGSVVKFRKLKANGDAVGVSVVGLYDRSTKQLEISGNLVPVNQVSKILGEVPVLGEVITGLDKSGVFVTPFKLTGSIDDPKPTVYPASSLAPGFLRDIFSPNWLEKESKRFFGAD